MPLARALLAAALTAAFTLTVVAANWAVGHFAPWMPIEGVIIPAGVWFAGLAFTLRDFLQKLAGPAATLFAIACGTFISYELGAGAIAMAAALAFAVSELVDFGVFVLTERRLGFVGAVAASGAVGLVVDSYIFLTVAPPLFPGAVNTDFLLGQVVGKGLVTLAAVALIAAARAARR